MNNQTLFVMQNAFEYHELKFKNVIEKLIDLKTWEGILTVGLGLVGAFLFPIYAFIFGSFALVWVDYLTGTKSAVKRGETISSKAMRRSIDKGLVYMGFIIAAHVIDVVFKIPFDPLAYIAALAVARVEFFSIDENVRQLTGVSIRANVSHLFRPPKSS